MLNKTSTRQIKWTDVEPLAKIFQTTPIEIIEHAHEWEKSIHAGAVLRSDLQEHAIRLAFDVLDEK
jgi:hypothetical protein